MIPIVECELHAPAPGYVVCRHVVHGAEPAAIRVATPTVLGQILCQACWDDPEPVAAELLVLVCSHCAHERGWLRGSELG